MARQEELPPVWVRDESARIWGPLSLATLELMVDHGVVSKPFEYSTDGTEFVWAPDDLLVGGASLPSAIAPPVLAATSNAPTGTSAMKAAVKATRAEQAARAPGTAGSPGGLPPRAGPAPVPRAPGSPLPPKTGVPVAGAPVPHAVAAAPPPKFSAPAQRVPGAPKTPAAAPPSVREAAAPLPQPSPQAAKPAPPKPGAPAANRVPRATTSKPVIAPPAPGTDGGMNLDAMLKDISEFKHKLPSEVLSEARKAAGLPDLNPAAPPPPPPPINPRSFQAAPPQGRLEEISGLQLYYLIAAADAGGMLTLDEGEDQVRLWFKQGTPQAVQSSSQGLGPFLVEHRAISAEAFEEALAESAEDPVSFLFASGKVNPSAIFPLIQQHSLAVLQRALLIEKGPFTFDPEEAPPSSGFPLGNRWEILAGAARKLDTISLQRRLAGREDQAPRLTGSTAELKLTALELRLATTLDGSRSLTDLIAAAPSEADAQLRVIVLLQELDRLTWQVPGGSSAGAGKPASVPRVSSSGRFRVPPAGGPPVATPFASAEPPAVSAQQPAPKPPAAAAPVPQPVASARPSATPPAKPPQVAAPAKPPFAAPAGQPTAAAPHPARPAPPKTSPPRTSPPRTSPPKTSPPGPAGPAIKAEDPGSFLAGLREKNFFERLGFTKSETAPPQLKVVYFQYAKIYHPDMLPADATPVQRKQREDILALLNEAYGVLSDDARRKDYLEQLAVEESGLDAADVEGILRAEEDFQRAVVLIRGHKVREGLAMIESCIQLNEKEGEFYAWRGYAKFLLATDKKAAFITAMNDVQKCLKMVARCPPAYLIEANMAKLIGDDEKAKAAFKKVLELEPNNIDATRELRLYQQRSGKK